MVMAYQSNYYTQVSCYYSSLFLNAVVSIKSQQINWLFWFQSQLCTLLTLVMKYGFCWSFYVKLRSNFSTQLILYYDNNYEIKKFGLCWLVLWHDLEQEWSSNIIFRQFRNYYVCYVPQPFFFMKEKIFCLFD